VVPEFWQAIAAFGGTALCRRSSDAPRTARAAGDRRVEGRALPYEAVRSRIAARLAERSLQQALREYAHGLLHQPEAHAH